MSIKGQYKIIICSELDLSNHKHVVHKNMENSSNMITDSERDMPGKNYGSLGWHTSGLTTELQQVMQ